MGSPLCPIVRYFQNQGATKGVCETALLLKELTYKMVRVTHTSLASFDNDAKYCYDRLVMKLCHPSRSLMVRCSREYVQYPWC